MITRLNKGKPAGTFLVQLGTWGLYETSEGRCKVAAITPVNGKANYAFGVKDGRISTHAGLDCTLLRADYPDLYKAVEAYLKDTTAPPETITTQEEADLYGDLALNKRRALTPEQHWKRGLLQMRRLEFEHAAVNRESIWESAVRMLWAGVFGTKISEEDCRDSLRWITDRQGPVDVQELLQLEQDYYNNRLGPRSCEKLEAGLADLTRNDFENEEEEKDGNIGSSLSASKGTTYRSVQEGHAGLREVRTDNSTAPVARPEEDRFAAFH